MTAILFVILGLVGLVVGGEMLVRGAVSTAKSFGISPMVIGLTLVGFGTSTPELVTSLEAALNGSSGIAIGNVIGSNIGNILLILGIAACIAPVAVNPAAFRRDGMALVAATALCLGVVVVGDIGRLSGTIMLASLAGYLYFTLRSERRAAPSPAGAVYSGEADLIETPDYAITTAMGIAVSGLVITIIGAKLLVSGAVTLAELAGISQTVIGLTIVAIGTSMPELVTTVIAMRKGQGDVALGNVIGSNLFNILGILGITALVQPLQIPPEILQLDIWVMSAATALLVVFARSGWRIGRTEGCVMVACYAAYLLWLLLP